MTSLQETTQRFEITKKRGKIEERLPRRLFLEASAGTGKTFTIEHYLLRAILESSLEQEALTPQQSLIVTFTKAAATELKDRIQERLRCAYSALELIQEALISEKINSIRVSYEAVENIFSSLNPEMAYLVEYVFGTFLDESLGVRIYLERVWKLRYSLSKYISDIDYASISTIHSFFDKILGEFQEKHVNQHANRGIWLTYEGITDWIRQCIAWSLPSDFMTPQEWEILMGSFRRNEDDFLKKISHQLSEESNKKILKREVGNFPYGEIRKSIWLSAQEKIKSICSWKKESIHHIIQQFTAWASGKKGAIRRGEKQVSKDFVIAFELLIDALFYEEFSNAVFDQLFRAYQILRPLFSAEDKKVRGASNVPEDLSLVSMISFRNDIWPLIDKPLSPEGLFDRLYEVISGLFCQYLETGKVKTPQSIVEGVFCLTTGSQNKDFIDFTRNRYKLVIIDEFQDTDAYQWNTFRTLFVDTNKWNGRILFVGDPKQAIYAFRKADVYSYLEARRCFDDEEKKTLGTNWRASKALVHAINCFFSNPIATKWLFYLPKITTSLSSEILEAPSQQLPFQSLRPDSSVHFFLSAKEIGRKKNWPSQDIEEKILFPWIARESLLLQKIEKVSLRDIAILVKDRYQASRITHFLRLHSLPSVMVRVDSITESPIFPLFIALLDLIDTPHDEKKIAAFFATTRSAQCISQAHLILNTTQQLAELVQNWSRIHTSFVQHGFGGMVYALAKKAVIGGLTLSEWIFSIYQGEKQYLIDLEHLLEIASVLFSQLNCKTLQEIKKGFSELSTLFYNDPDMLMRRFDISEDAIQIMTMHRSKGLEFSVVFALGAASRTLSLDEDGETFTENRQRELELDAEKMRQLYVACTRAKRRLYLPFCVETSLKETSIGTKSPLELFFLGHKQAQSSGTLDIQMATISLEEWKKAMYQSLSYNDVITIIENMKKSSSDVAFSITYSTEKELEEDVTLFSGEGVTLDSNLEDREIGDRTQRVSIEAMSKSVHKEKCNWQYATRKYVSFSSLLRSESKRAEKRSELGSSTLYNVLLKSVPNFHMSESGKEDSEHMRGISQRILGIRFHTVINAWTKGYGASRVNDYKNCDVALDCLKNWIITKFPAWRETSDELARMLYHAVTIELPLSYINTEKIALHQLSRSAFTSEQYFLDPVTLDDKKSTGIHRTLIQGSIDVVIQVNNLLFLVDWKTNTIPDNVPLEEYVNTVGYHLQAREYIKAAQKYISHLKREDNNADIDFGGFIFIFLSPLAASKNTENSEMIREIGLLFRDSNSSPQSIFKNPLLLPENKIHH